MVLSTGATEFLVVPYLTGPEVKRQRIRITDADSHSVIREIHPLKTEDVWRFHVIRLPAGTQRVAIEAADEGDGWGEWHAIAGPRMLKAD